METDAAAPGKYHGLRAFGGIYLALTIAGTAASIDPGSPMTWP
jgi:hypothetical protein